MKTLKGFFKKSSHPDIFEKTWEAGGVDWEDYKESPSDYYAANSGSVPGMIYYSDTVSFAKINHSAILELLCDFENECGTLDKKNLSDETSYFNWLAWFAWENMCSELNNYLDA